MSQRQDEVAEDSRRKLRGKIEKYRLRMTTLEAEAANTSMEKEVAHALETEMREIQARIDELEKNLYAEAREQSIRQDSLQLRYKECFKVHESAHQFLEAAFVDARLLSPLPKTLKVPVLRKWVSEESGQQDEKTCEVRRAPGDGLSKQRHEECAHEDQQQSVTTEGMPNSLNSRSTSRHHPGTSELQDSSKSSDLYRDYVRAKNRLSWAQWEFDLRDETREREYNWNERDLRRSGGTESIAQEDSDLRWVEHNSKLTRALIDAEEAFKTARIAAVRGGCQLDDLDASSIFEDVENEGYPPSREAIWKADAPI